MTEKHIERRGEARMSEDEFRTHTLRTFRELQDVMLKGFTDLHEKVGDNFKNLTLDMEANTKLTSENQTLATQAVALAKQAVDLGVANQGHIAQIKEDTEGVLKIYKYGEKAVELSEKIGSGTATGFKRVSKLARVISPIIGFVLALGMLTTSIKTGHWPSFKDIAEVFKP